jgi:uncharacterized delta-60 repeat protein
LPAAKIRPRSDALDNKRMPFGASRVRTFLNDLEVSAPPLAPLDPSGDPDTSFSGDGKVITNFAEVSQFAEARGVGIQSNGKIIIGGFSYEGGVNRYFAVLRLNTDGTQDFSFGNQNVAGGEIGVAKLSIGTATSNINALAVYPVTGGVNDDKIVGAGFSQSGSDQFAIARFTKDGALDTTFGPDLHAPAGPDGYIEVDFAGFQDRAAAVAIQDDGKIVVAGFAQDASGQRSVAVVRLTASGVLDTTFSGDGKATVDYTDLSASADDRGTAVVISGTGASRKIIVGGWTKVSGVSRFHLMQFLDNGSLDPAFGDNGKRVFPVINGSSGGDEIRGMTLDSSNRICRFRLSHSRRPQRPGASVYDLGCELPGARHEFQRHWIPDYSSVQRRYGRSSKDAKRRKDRHFRVYNAWEWSKRSFVYSIEFERLA